MKIIDILNKMANGTLEDGFKFKWYGLIYTFNKKSGFRDRQGNTLSENAFIECCLNDEVEVIEKTKEIEEIDEDICMTTDVLEKINELVRAVNKLNKEREVK